MQQVLVEIADEITTVIERIKAASSRDVALVVPKGAVLLQSVVNLKLAKKAAADSGKEITLITTDKIGRNLASQVGITNMASLGDVPTESPGPAEPKVIAGVKIHRYYDAETPEPEVVEEVSEPIIPRDTLTPMSEEENPIVKREVLTEIPVVERIVARGTQPAPVIVVDTKEMSPTPQSAQPSNSVTPPVVKPAKRPSSRRRTVGMFTAYILLLLLLGGAAVSVLYYPITNIVVIAPGEAWTKTFTSTAQVDTDPTGLEKITTASLSTTEKEESLEFAATGSKNIGKTATGTVELRNYTDSDAKVLVAGAKLTANGVAFTTSVDATVPGFRRVNGVDVPGSVKVAVSATDSGEAGNVTASTVAITSPQTNLSARDLVATGGTSEIVKTVTQTDIANAKNALTKQLEASTLQAAEESATSSNAVSTPSADTVALDDFRVNVNAGDQTDKGTVTTKATRKRILVSKDMLNERVQLFAKSDITSGIELTVTKADITDLRVDTSKGTAAFTVIASGTTHKPVPLDTIRKQILGKSDQNGSDLVKSIVNGAEVRIERTPSWWPLHRIPYTDRYVTVSAEHE